MKRFQLYNRCAAVLALLVSAVTYLLTIEPTASFWDCGEFIASSYKLEVGHPPGNPVFQLIARFFTLFTDGAHAAVAVNVMSALCSALTIFLLYLTIVFLVKRLVGAPEGSLGSSGASAGGQDYSLSQTLIICGSGLVGSLAYCFSDTFWFSAVEGEVYAMSSLFTALVFWAMTKWYEQADEPYANRWIVLISFLMGLSIGVHLLNLLTIPCLVFLYFYRKREDKPYSFKELCGIFLQSVVILGVVLFVIIPWLPKVAAYVDLFFVNVLGCPYNVGAAVFMLVLLGLCYWGIVSTRNHKRVFWHTALLCLTTIVIGFSIFSICIIRSSVKTPTNEYQPDNPFTLVRYLAREQYGSTPLLYGQYFDAPYDIKENQYWASLNGKYVYADGPGEVEYEPQGKMLFPRMWSGSDPKYVRFYEAYMGGGGIKVSGADHAKPTFLQNLYFFFDYQLGWMYGRYFMWNFVGRQNDYHSPSPGEIFTGNWESGIGFIDKFRLGDQSTAPDYLRNNKAKNHYYFLPLLLGLLGLFFQYARDKRGFWITFLLFFMTGIAVVIYLNQPPYQVRERDYAYAGSFYAFSIWIGMGVAAVYGWLKDAKASWAKPVSALAVSLLCLGVPALMAAQNWDDHDRSNRYTAVEIAYNYLNSVGENGILVTHGDNDTFPLWYAQEVENIRTDVRICNTSLLGTDWYIDQMKYACNESAPLKLSVGPEQYLYGTNEYVYIYDKEDKVRPISEVMAVFRNPKYRLALASRKVDFIWSRKISVPVNKENVIKYGILDAKYADRIPDEIVLTMSPDKSYLSKPELFMLDLLSNYQWDRPLHLLSMGGDLNIGIKDYLMYDGFSYRFVPIKSKTKMSQPGFTDPEDLYRKMTQVYRWDALRRTDWFVDYQNLYTFMGVMSQRMLYVTSVKEMLKQADRDKEASQLWKDRARQLLDDCMENVPEANFPLDVCYLGFSNELMVSDLVDLYFKVGENEKALALAERFYEQLNTSLHFFGLYLDYAYDNFDTVTQLGMNLGNILKKNGETQRGKEMISETIATACAYDEDLRKEFLNEKE